MTYLTFEQAARKAWPAIEEKELPYGVLRFAHGYTRRANSMTLFNSRMVPAQELILQCEDFFGSRNLPSIIRMPSFASMGRLDSYLGVQGYSCIAPSRVMTCSLGKSHLNQFVADSVGINTWLDCYYQISGKDVTSRTVQASLLGHIEGESRFARLLDETGRPACCAIAVLFNGVLGIYNVATNVSHRRRNFATRLMVSLLAWGFARRATHAFLQVEESNVKAINLYGKLGFKNFYRYWYRQKKLVDFK